MVSYTVTSSLETFVCCFTQWKLQQWIICMPLSSLAVRGLYCSRVDLKPKMLRYFSEQHLVKIYVFVYEWMSQGQQTFFVWQRKFWFSNLLSSELLLSFTKSGNVMDSEVTDLRLSLSAIAAVVNLCASPDLALFLSWFVTSCITGDDASVSAFCKIGFILL